MNTFPILLGALCVYALAYRYYSAFIAAKALALDDRRITPANRFADGHNYVASPKWVLFGHHFAAIAGAGPLVGPTLAAQFGFLPGFLWLLIGAVLAGCVQDFTVLVASMRHRGRSLAAIARSEISPFAGLVTMVAVLFILLVTLAGLGIVVVNALANSPWGVFTIGSIMPIALVMGWWMFKSHAGRITVAGPSVFGVALLIAAVVGGHWFATSSAAGALTFSPHQITLLMATYGFIASVLPVWLLLAPRDYLSTFLKIGTITSLAIGIFIVWPDLKMPAISRFVDGTGPVFAGSLFPFLFITIACGALSGFHALISSGTTPKLLEKESQMRFIGYGGMLTESFVAVMALITASIINQHLYFTLNAPPAQTGGTAASAAKYVNGLGLSGAPATADQLNQAAASVGEKSIVSRTGGAPTLAFGMSEVLQKVFGGAGLKAFWYHFAIMFEALFILTAVDAGTRVARLMLSDALGNLGGPLAKLRNPSWRPGVWICSLVVVAAWGGILLMGVTDPLGGINTLFPLFGIANQLLAAIALTVITVVVIKKGLLKWALIPGVPLLWDLAVTLTASWQKIFSADPNIGYWSQHAQYSAAKHAGKTAFGSAKNAHQLNEVIRNTFIQGSLSILFALVVVIVVVAGIIVALKAARGGGRPLTEDDSVPSRLFAPSGLIPTAAEREVQRQWDAG